MDLRKVNEIHARYRQAEGAAATAIFNELYGAVEEQRTINRSMVIRSGYGDESDAQTIFDDVVWRLAQRESIEDFGRALTLSLRNARIDFIRKSKRRVGGIERWIDDDRPGADTRELTDDYRIEDDALKKKEADQRQLIDSLTIDPGQVDPVTTLIVAEFPRYKSITALAKALGLHHEVVKRKLRSLSRRYDANRFGEYSDYLAV